MYVQEEGGVGVGARRWVTGSGVEEVKWEVGGWLVEWEEVEEEAHGPWNSLNVGARFRARLNSELSGGPRRKGGAGSRDGTAGLGFGVTWALGCVETTRSVHHRVTPPAQG